MKQKYLEETIKFLSLTYGLQNFENEKYNNLNNSYLTAQGFVLKLKLAFG
jgi:hypothetical protein